MAEHLTAMESVESQPAPGTEHGGAPSVIDASGTVMVWTWICFAVTALILYKVAWKPILQALLAREETIRKALEDAEKARAELATVEARKTQTLADAQVTGEGIIGTAREVAEKMADKIRAEAESAARNTVEGAHRDIEAAVAKARRELGEESAQLAVQLAGRVVRENMDTEKNRALVDKLIGEGQ